MSLVNKMLRDLDARRVGDGERAALPAAVTPLSSTSAQVMACEPTTLRTASLHQRSSTLAPAGLV